MDSFRKKNWSRWVDPEDEVLVDEALVVLVDEALAGEVPVKLAVPHRKVNVHGDPLLNDLQNNLMRI